MHVVPVHSLLDSLETSEVDMAAFITSKPSGVSIDSHFIQSHVPYDVVLERLVCNVVPHSAVLVIQLLMLLALPLLWLIWRWS